MNRALGLVTLCWCALSAQETATTAPSNQAFSRRAVIRQEAGFASIFANDPSPLRQAIFEVRLKYGWMVDFEEAPVTGIADLVDNSAPQWRASHPSEKGYWIPKGGPFSSTFSTDLDSLQDSSGEEAALARLVADYNASGNPGRYILRKEGNHRFALVGEYQAGGKGAGAKASPILDTEITFPRSRRSTRDTIDLVLREVSAANGTTVVLTSCPENLFARTEVEAGGSRVAARELLLEALAPTGRPFIWVMPFDSNDGTYFMTIELASKSSIDQFGRERLCPVDRPQRCAAPAERVKSVK
jgi:hypothetical protein